MSDDGEDEWTDVVDLTRAELLARCLEDLAEKIRRGEITQFTAQWPGGESDLECSAVIDLGLAYSNALTRADDNEDEKEADAAPVN